MSSVEQALQSFKDHYSGQDWMRFAGLIYTREGTMEIGVYLDKQHEKKVDLLPATWQGWPLKTHILGPNKIKGQT
jgi:hypothetical protein